MGLIRKILNLGLSQFYIYPSDDELFEKFSNTGNKYIRVDTKKEGEFYWFCMKNGAYNSITLLLEKKGIKLNIKNNIALYKESKGKVVISKESNMNIEGLSYVAFPVNVDDCEVLNVMLNEIKAEIFTLDAKIKEVEEEAKKLRDPYVNYLEDRSFFENSVFKNEQYTFFSPRTKVNKMYENQKNEIFLEILEDFREHFLTGRIKGESPMECVETFMDALKVFSIENDSEEHEEFFPLLSQEERLIKQHEKSLSQHYSVLVEHEKIKLYIVESLNLKNSMGYLGTINPCKK